MMGPRMHHTIGLGLIAGLLALGAILTAGKVANTGQTLFLPVFRSPAVAPGIIHPPGDVSCLLQAGTSSVIDPRTGSWLHSCEGKNGLGQVVWSGSALLMKNVAVGSGSLVIEDQQPFITAVNEDGTLVQLAVPLP
jgi:hypothetical protein